MNFNPNPLLLTDSYKLSHEGFMEKTITKVISNMTARSLKHFSHKEAEHTVFFGLQYFIKEFLISYWNKHFFERDIDEVIGEAMEVINAYLGKGSVPEEHFRALHKLGYLPLLIKALPEGSKVPVKVPYYTIENTHDDFAWVTNYVETVISAELWKMITSATSTYYNRRLVNDYALETTGSLAGTEFQVHDFSFRGMSNWLDSASSGAAFLLSSCGTDNIPAIPFLVKYYNADLHGEFIGTSIPATEHSIQCSGTAIQGSEFNAYKKWITEDYPTGLVSVVSDGFDYWRVIGEYLPQLKDIIMNRPDNELGLSKVVIRPDSGDPVEIVCGKRFKDYTLKEIDVQSAAESLAEDLVDEEVELAGHGEMGNDELEGSFIFDGKYYKVNVNVDWDRHDKQYYYVDCFRVSSVEEFTPEVHELGTVEALWNIFGGDINEQGYRVLDRHIGVIYGDGINTNTAKEIMERLKEKGFASTNIVFGFGSYSAQFVTRDTLGIAVKATAVVNDGQLVEIFKDPKTDTGMKKSAKGLIRVDKDANGEYTLRDQVSWEEYEGGDLQPVFLNGKLLREDSLRDIRNRLWNN